MSSIKCFLLTRSERNARIDCGFVFVYRDQDGREFHLGNVDIKDEYCAIVPAAPVGAMWDCDWMHDCHESSGLAYNRNPDGLVLCVRCPGGDWVIDGPSKDGGCWARTGTAPNITVTPSILQPTYHGWLRNGELVSV